MPARSVTPAVTEVKIEPKKPAVKKLNPIKLKLLEDEFAAAEEAIAEWERRIGVAEEKMSVFTTMDEQQKGAGELDRLRVEHAELMGQWEAMGMELEEQRD